MQVHTDTTCIQLSQVKTCHVQIIKESTKRCTINTGILLSHEDRLKGNKTSIEREIESLESFTMLELKVNMSRSMKI